jgi:hypothetical protein
MLKSPFYGLQLLLIRLKQWQNLTACQLKIRTKVNEKEKLAKATAKK